MRRFPLPAVTAGLVLTATSALSLPTDMGRSADVYTNAVRYFAARSQDPAFWPAPKLRPTYLASAVSPDAQQDVVAEAIAADPVPLTAPQDRIAGAPAQVIASAAAAQLQAGPVIAEVAPALDLPEVQDVVAESTIVDQVAAVANAAPELIAPSEGGTVEADVIDAANDLAVETVAAVADVPAEPEVVAALPTPDPHPEIVAAAPVVADTEAATVEVQPAALAVAEAVVTAGSSRLTGSPHPEVTFVADVPLPADDVADVDLMSQMADADDNLVIRDGGEDGPDTMMMSSDVLFSFGKAALADDALATLAGIGDMADSVAIIEVFGHTDAIGNEANNLALGQRRAEAVRQWLLQNTDFTEDRIIATGIGEVDPVAPNLAANGDDNPEGRAQNRRVEFAFHDAGYVPE